MANVNIKFNNKDYLLSCDDGQEEDLKKKVLSQKKNFENLSEKFKEMKSLAIDYKEGKETEISKLNLELDKFRKMVEESHSIYETMLDKTTKSLEEIIKNTENESQIQ